jgi:SAM-dependent methyltransferase
MTKLNPDGCGSEEKASMLNASSIDDSQWKINASEELKFWRDIIRGWDKKFMNTNREELRDFIKELLCLPRGGFARLLDVGSGPVTKLGTHWDDRTLELTLIDPLANEYNQMLDDAGLHTYPRPIKAFGEELVARFGPNAFDLVFSQNALDHSMDPARCIQEMIGVTKPSGIIAFNVTANEGKRNGYVGLHQWDFTFCDGKVYLSDVFGIKRILDEICEDKAIYSAEVKSELINNLPADFIYVVIRKKADIP